MKRVMRLNEEKEVLNGNEGGMREGGRRDGRGRTRASSKVAEFRVDRRWWERKLWDQGKLMNCLVCLLRRSPSCSHRLSFVVLEEHYANNAPMGMF